GRKARRIPSPSQVSQCGISPPDRPALPDLASVSAATGCRPGLRFVRTAPRASGSGCTDRTAAAVGGVFESIGCGESGLLV
uniref:Uncharacterized protein n=1 Tax=Aegilops tauschii subsp. strangulata TaxID=200361 RepID=A0A453GKB3_AEGTS